MRTSHYKWVRKWWPAKLSRLSQKWSSQRYLYKYRHTLFSRKTIPCFQSPFPHFCRLTTISTFYLEMSEHSNIFSITSLMMNAMATLQLSSFNSAEVVPGGSCPLPNTKGTFNHTKASLPCALQCRGTGESGTAAKYRVDRSHPPHSHRQTHTETQSHWRKGNFWMNNEQKTKGSDEE